MFEGINTGVRRFINKTFHIRVSGRFVNGIRI